MKKISAFHRDSLFLKDSDVERAGELQEIILRDLELSQVNNSADRGRVLFAVHENHEVMPRDPIGNVAVPEAVFSHWILNA